MLDSDLPSFCQEYSNLIFCVLYILGMTGLIGGVAAFKFYRNGQSTNRKNDKENSGDTFTFQRRLSPRSNPQK